jgi:hypothetical protein
MTKVMQYWEIRETWNAKRRWLLEPDPESDDWLCRNRHRLTVDYPPPKWPEEPPSFVYRTLPDAGPLDYPGVSIHMFIISERLRIFFNHEVPGKLSFYPIHVKGPNSESLQRYYATRFEHEWDCLHPYAWDEDALRGRFVAFPVLDRTKIPPDGVIGGVKHFGVLWLVRDDMKRKLMREGFSGFDLQKKADFIDDGSAPIFEHVNQKRPWPGGGSGAVEAEKPSEASRTVAGNKPKNCTERKRKPKAK